MTVELADKLLPIVDNYHGLIIDQWGVLHNGREPYPGVFELLTELKRRNKTLVLLTNSGRRTDYNKERLSRMGFNMGIIDGIVTSGEAGWRAVRDRAFAPYDELGKRCFLITRRGDMGVVEGLDLKLVEAVEDADFVFLTGVDSPPMTLDDYRPIMEQARKRDLPVICSNPDRVAVSSQGLVTAPGAVADLYEKLGGTVYYVGKPNKPIYAAALSHLHEFELDDILAIGDSLEHDIKGANGAGVDSILIKNGIHQERIESIDDTQAALRELCEHYDAWPTYMVSNFRM